MFVRVLFIYLSFIYHYFLSFFPPPEKENNVTFKEYVVINNFYLFSFILQQFKGINKTTIYLCKLNMFPLFGYIPIYYSNILLLIPGKSAIVYTADNDLINYERLPEI